MAAYIGRIQDANGADVYPQVKKEGIVDFPSNFLTSNDVKVTKFTNSVLLNGATAPAVDGVIIELPNFAILTLGSGITKINCGFWKKIDLLKVPVSLVSKYSHCIVSVKNVSNSENHFFTDFETTTGTVSITAVGKAMDNDTIPLNFIAVLTK